MSGSVTPTTMFVNYISCRGAPISLCVSAPIRFPKAKKQP